MRPPCAAFIVYHPVGIMSGFADWPCGCEDSRFDHRMHESGYDFWIVPIIFKTNDSNFLLYLENEKELYFQNRLILRYLSKKAFSVICGT
jgi:hypothetical protein